MSVKIAELAEELGLESKELKAKLEELGFGVKPKARTIDDEVAELVRDELTVDSGESDDTAEVYEEMIGEQLDREIIKSQRKQTAGRSGKKGSKEEEAVKVSGTVEIPEIISVKEFSEKLNVSAVKVIGELMKNGILANINQQIDYETASIIAEELGVKLKQKTGEGKIEDVIEGNLEALLKESDDADLSERPPVISIMGHVDHGKTKLLDTIRQANVIDTESGGITQHIGAYQVEKKGKKITFLDTPGHEAFTAMRARGAKATDIAILVVAADEGVKPQTIEAINHGKEAGIPIIVAINKMDKPAANPDKVKGELVEHGLNPEDWGGDTMMVPVSAIKGDGIDNLLDAILLTAEVAELKANPNRAAVGSIIEAHLDKSLGPVATVLVNTGTMNIGDSFICGDTFGRVKIIRDHLSKSHEKAGPSDSVLISGFQTTPHSGDVLQVMPDEKTARRKAEEISTLKHQSRKKALMGADKLAARVSSGKLNKLKIILKADTKGSLEAIMQSLDKVKTDEVAISVIHSGVGNATESDVMMAAASEALLITFHVDATVNAKAIAENEGVEISKYEIIYKLIEDLTRILSGMIEPEEVINELGKATVKQVFYHKKKEMVVGCSADDGKIINECQFRIIREGEELEKPGKVMSLQKGKDTVKEIKAGVEFGVKIEIQEPLLEGDKLEFFTVEMRERTIEDFN